MKPSQLSFVLLLSAFLFALEARATFNDLSSEEARDVEARLDAFASGALGAMNQREPKYDLSQGRFVESAPDRAGVSSSDPLLSLAGFKASPEFSIAYCHMLRKYAPGLKCVARRAGTWAAVQDDDRVESLVSGWMTTIDDNLTTLPVRGTTARLAWSDDYWRTRWGGLSFRYAQHENGSGYARFQDSVNAYAQPNEWFFDLSRVAPTWLGAYVDTWSPAEKYDLSVGDESFTLTRQQKYFGRNYFVRGEVPAWMGLCHGWAPASLMVPRPVRGVRVVGARGVPIVWYPSDIRAILTLAWAMNRPTINSVGGLCHDEHPKTYSNGRIRDQECFDSNPATFHLALGNLIGKAHVGFVMDKSLDYQIWNQPIRGYELTYYNPLNTRQLSKDWRQVAVPYDARFKRTDRFQHPHTRGVIVDGRRLDGGIQKIVGVIASVTYVSEVHPPRRAGNPNEDALRRATYLYDLELYERDGRLIPLGGEWHQNSHPDYLWIPRPETTPTTAFDRYAVPYYGGSLPWPQLTQIAQQASAHGSHLYRVLKVLVQISSGVDAYRCP